jgi:hypothetical protein
MSKKMEEGKDPDEPQVEEDDDNGDSVRTVSTTVASLWTGHQTHKRLLQKHFMVSSNLSLSPA